jgi:hypothetical protein
MQGRGHVYRVVLKQNARAKLPDPFIFHRKKRRKRRRQPTEWLLARRHLMDAGKHEGFSQVEVWAESAYWIEKERIDKQRPEMRGSVSVSKIAANLWHTRVVVGLLDAKTAEAA